MTDRIGFKPDYYPTAPPQHSPPPQYPFPPAPPSHFPPHHPPSFPLPSFSPHHPPSFPPHHQPSFSPHHPPSFPPHHPPSFPPHHPPSFGPHPGFPVQHPGCPDPPSGSYVVKGYYWVATTARQGVPASAVRGGVDQDGTQIYVGRAHHEGDWIPAKVIPEKNVAYVAYGGKEHAKSEYQVLCEQTFEWVHTSGSNIPPEAVVGGQTSDGEPLYVGRVHHAGSHTVGKVHPSHGTCYIPFDGEELGFADYEILVLRG